MILHDEATETRMLLGMTEQFKQDLAHISLPALKREAETLVSEYLKLTPHNPKEAFKFVSNALNEVYKQQEESVDRTLN